MTPIQTQKIVLLIAFFAIAANAQTEKICFETSVLQLFNLTRIDPVRVTNGTCRTLYSDVGACVPVTQTLAALQNRYSWLRRKAVDAQNYNLQIANASLYFQVQNGQISVADAVAKSIAVPSSNSIFSSITNALSSVMNKLGSIFGSIPAWLKGNFDAANNSINPCLQAWQNLTDASMCLFTSANNIGFKLTSQVTDMNTPVISFAAQYASAGRLMRQCNGLLDTYCTLTYGISVTQASAPFNKTFNWNDNSGWTSDLCLSFAGYINKTDTLSSAGIDAIYLESFHTNFIRFIPNAASIQNLGSFLTNPAFNQPVTAFVPVTAKADDFGFGVTATVTTNVIDMVELAKSSGAPVNVYSAMKFAIGIVMGMMSMYI